MARLWVTRGDTEEFRRGGLIRIAFGLKQDLAALGSPTAIAAAMTAAGSENAASAGRAAGQLFRFADAMAIGDRVLTYDKSRRVYHVGDIVGDYQFEADKDPHTPGCHVRKVSWIGEVQRDALSTPARNTLGSLMTVFEPDELVADEIDAALRGETPKPAAVTQAAKPANGDKPKVVIVAATDSDDESMDAIRRDVIGRATEFIKDKIASLDWEDMQDLVAAILRAMGYKTRVTARGPDRGRDILASPDGLGLSPPRIKVEVKHRQNAMGAPDLRSFIGSLRGDDRGLYVSTGGFTREAQYEADRSAIHVAMLDLDDLAELLVQHYDAIDTEGRALVPLKRVFFPKGI